MMRIVEFCSLDCCVFIAVNTNTVTMQAARIWWRPTEKETQKAQTQLHKYHEENVHAKSKHHESACSVDLIAYKKLSVTLVFYW